MNYRPRSNRKPQSHSRKPNRPLRPDINPDRYIQAAQPKVEQTPVHITHTFEDFGLNPQIVKNVRHKGYVKPTPIQDQAILHVMAGTDVLGIANTGTGKTAAFALPILHNIVATQGQTRALILAPTRELATQIGEEIESFSHHLNVISALCIGGAPMNPQIMMLKRQPKIVIATPGRAMDLVWQGYLDLSQFNVVILDEVDRMLDMGFIKDVRFLVENTKADRQTLFFSATITKDIENLISSFLKNPVKVSVRTQETSVNVEQDVVYVQDKIDKLNHLSQILGDPQVWKAIVFTRTKREADSLGRKLEQLRFMAGSIHGDKPQRKRDQVIRMFRNNKINILVATDVAARGLDISDISHVINYDEPGTYEDYVHRIGRTGRAGKTGKAITFVVKAGGSNSTPLHGAASNGQHQQRADHNRPFRPQDRPMQPRHDRPRPDHRRSDQPRNNFQRRDDRPRFQSQAFRPPTSSLNRQDGANQE